MNTKKKAKAAPVDASEAAARKRAVDGLLADMQAPEIRTAPIGPITAEELAEIDRLHRAAAPGPWVVCPSEQDRDNREIKYRDKGLYRLAIVCGWDRHEEHAAFIALARTLLPRLAVALREALADRDALAAKVESLLARCDALTQAKSAEESHANKLASLVRTMITEADAHRDGVKTDRSSTAALASERLWAAAEEAREALKKARR